MSNESTWYLDAAATAPLRPEARAAMLAVLDEGQVNPSSVHQAGHRARSTVERARERIAAAFGVRASGVIFTSGGTEANNLAVIGLALARPRGRHIVTSAIEHPAVAESCRFLERVHGFEVSVIGVDAHGRIDPAAVAAELRDDTALLTIGLANGEVGTVQPLPEIAETARRLGVVVHSDAVQAAATLPVSLASGGWPGAAVDALSLAAHKFGGPQGAGALVLRRQLELEPLLHGGGQEGGARSGTENVAAIAGFAAAVEASTATIGSRAAALARSRDRLVELVLAEVPGAELTGHPTERLPGHASFVVRGVSGESLLVALDAAGIAVSSGSACAAGKDEPSPVLLAMGIDPVLAQTAIRFTLPAPFEGETGDALLRRIVDILGAEATAAAGKRRDPGAVAPGHAHTGR